MVEKRASIKFEDDLLEKVNALKKYYGAQSGAELVRILVNEKARQLNIGPSEVMTDANQ